MMKLKLLAGVAALCLTGAAVATDFTLGNLSNRTTSIGASHASQEGFLDKFFFDVSGPGNFVGVTFSLPLDLDFAPGIEFNTDLLAVALFTAAGAPVFLDDTPGDGLVVATTVAAGSYMFVVGGQATGTLGGSYAGIMASVVAVPEPETYALLLTGLGAIGLLARRRRAG